MFCAQPGLTYCTALSQTKCPPCLGVRERKGGERGQGNVGREGRIVRVRERRGSKGVKENWRGARMSRGQGNGEGVNEAKRTEWGLREVKGAERS